MDDAVLSIGGTMWLRRNECEFIIISAAGISNFTSYYVLRREYFNVDKASELRRAESAIVVRHLGGHHLVLDLPDAPLRYRGGNWSLDWFKKHRDSIMAFGVRTASPSELDQWTDAIGAAIATYRADELWMPLGVGHHTDHHLTRDACLRIITRSPDLVDRCVLKFYEDAPYAAFAPNDTPRLLSVLARAGASIEEQREDITSSLAAKLHLLSIFGSQFKMDFMRPRIEKCARLVGGQGCAYGERFFRVISPPVRDVEGLPCSAEGD